MNDVEKASRIFTTPWLGRHSGRVGRGRAISEKFSPPYYPYHDGVNDRTLKCFSALGGNLLMAGGGDPPETHVAIAKMFSATTFLDISDRALAIAKRNSTVRLSTYVIARGIPKPEHYFDAAYCAHVIYHIDKDLQETAIRELIRVTDRAVES